MSDSGLAPTSRLAPPCTRPSLRTFEAMNASAETATTVSTSVGTVRVEPSDTLLVLHRNSNERPVCYRTRFLGPGGRELPMLQGLFSGLRCLRTDLGPPTGFEHSR